MREKTRWLLAKYVPVLERNEPRNVGVVLLTEDSVYTRFRDDKPDWILHPDNYKDWVEYWLLAIDGGDGDDTPEKVEAKLCRRRAGDNYYMEVGGESILGKREIPADQFLDRLYERLVM